MLLPNNYDTSNGLLQLSMHAMFFMLHRTGPVNQMKAVMTLMMSNVVPSPWFTSRVDGNSHAGKEYYPFNLEWHAD